MRIVPLLATVGVVAVGAVAARYAVEQCGTHHAKLGAAERASVGELSADAGTSHDPVMSTVCRFSCATDRPHEEKDLAPQPGATAGKLTRCPVSGVVFAVAEDRPRVRLGTAEYVVCCDRCAEKLTAEPEHYVRL